jgi:hypothetical protein
MVGASRKTDKSCLSSNNRFGKEHECARTGMRLDNRGYSQIARTCKQKCLGEGEEGKKDGGQRRYECLIDRNPGPRAEGGGPRET